MTPQQRRTLDFIVAFYAEHRIAPSVREIAQAEGLRSIGSVHNRVKALVKSGHLIRTADQRRNIVPATDNLADIPTARLIAELERRSKSRHG